MLVLGTMQNDQRLPQSRCYAGVEGRVPLPVFVAKSNNHNVGLAYTTSGADRVETRTLVIMPELILFRTENCHTAIIAGLLIGNRPVEAHVEIACSFDDLIAPVSVNFP